LIQAMVNTITISNFTIFLIVIVFGDGREQTDLKWENSTIIGIPTIKAIQASSSQRACQKQELHS
jgi:hypothetical protein